MVKQYLIPISAVFIFFTSITIIYLSMRAVLDIGGYCAEGGPYEINVHCPKGVPFLMTFSIFGMIGSIFLYLANKSNADVVAILFWPTIFCSLGWNFLEYGFNPPQDEGMVMSWLFCGALFEIMGLGPIILLKDILRYRSNGNIKFDKGFIYSLLSQFGGIISGILLGVIIYNSLT